jgi:hypothetical protein
MNARFGQLLFTDSVKYNLVKSVMNLFVLNPKYLVELKILFIPFLFQKKIKTPHKTQLKNVLLSASLDK